MKDVRRTNLTVPRELAEKIDAEAQRDRRTYVPEVVVLLEEAIAAREKARGEA